MAFYGVKYRMTVKKELHGRTNTSRIDILKKGYGQGQELAIITDIRGDAKQGGFKHMYENLDPKNLYDTPIQKSRIDAYILCQSEDEHLGYDGLAILEEIFNADESEFKMIRYYNGVPVWQGYVLPDLLEYPDGDYSFSGKITAKDFSRLPSFSIGTTNLYQTPIDIIASCLQTLGYSLPIKTYTTWTEAGIIEADDILNQLQHNKRQLQDFSDDPDSDSINAEKALRYILKNYGLVLRQVDNAFRLYQISALQDPSSVQQYSYAADGSNYVNDGLVDLRTNVDRDLIDKVKSGINQVNAGLKFATATFTNDNPINALTLNRLPSDLTDEDPTQLVVTNFEDPDWIRVELTSSTAFISNGSQYLFINGSLKESARASLLPNTFPDIDFYTYLKIKAGSYYLNQDYEWQTTPTKIKILLDILVNEQTLEGTFNIISAAPIPVDAESPIELSFNSTFFEDEDGEKHYEDGSIESLSSLTWFNLQSGLSYSKSRLQTTDEITYKLQRNGDFSSDYEYGEFIWGDGPAPGDNSAIKSGSLFTQNNWGFRGGSLNLPFANLLLKEVLNVQRDATRNYSALLLGRYSPADLLQYRTRNSFFLGGAFNAHADSWDVQLLSISFNNAADDAFKVVIDEERNVSNNSGSSPGSPSSGGPGGLSQQVADNIYLNEAENLADLNDTSAARNNMDVYSKGESDGRYVRFNTIPSLDQVILNNPPSQDNHALRAGQVLNTDAPLAGGGKLRNGLHVKLDFNPVNLKSGPSGLDTIQDIHPDAEMELKSLLIKEGITLDELAEFVQTQIFAGGFAGEGMQLRKDEDGKWKLTVDDIVIRNSAQIYEILVTQLQAFAAFLLTEGHRVEEVEQVGDASWSWNDTTNVFADGATNAEGIAYTYANHWKCYIPEDKLLQLATDDLLLRQDFDGRNIGSNEATVIDVEQGDVNPTDNNPRRSFTVYLEDDAAVPLAGWQFARSGNRTDTRRQGGIYFVGSGADAPYQRMYDGVDRHSKFGKMETIISQNGLLDNLVLPEFPDLDGTQDGLYGQVIRNIYASGVINVTGGNAATIDYVDSQTAGTGLQAKLDAILDNAVTNETTIIEGGFIKTSFIELDAIAVGDLSDGDSYETKLGAQSKVNSLQGDIDSVLDDAIANGTTIIVGGFIKTDLIEAGSITATKLDVNKLEAVATSTGALEVDGPIDIVQNGMIRIGNSDLMVDKDGIAFKSGNTGSNGGINQLEWREGNDLVGHTYAYRSLGTNRMVIRVPTNSGSYESLLSLTAGRVRASGAMDIGGKLVGGAASTGITSSGFDSISQDTNATTLVINSSTGSDDIGYIEGENGQFLLLLNKSGREIRLVDKPAVSGGNLELGSNYGLLNDRWALLYNDGGDWHVQNDRG